MKSVRVNLSEGRWFRGHVLSSTGLYTTVVVTDPGTVDETVGRSVICSNNRLAEDTEEETSEMRRHARAQKVAVAQARIRIAVDEIAIEEDLTTAELMQGLAAHLYSLTSHTVRAEWYPNGEE